VIPLLEIGSKPSGTMKFERRLRVAIFFEPSSGCNLNKRCVGEEVPRKETVLGDVVTNYSLLLVAEDAMMRTMNFEMPGPPSLVLLPLLLPGVQELTGDSERRLESSLRRF
jgi:hypothetical protein